MKLSPAASSYRQEGPDMDDVSVLNRHENQYQTKPTQLLSPPYLDPGKKKQSQTADAAESDMFVEQIQ